MFCYLACSFMLLKCAIFTVNQFCSVNFIHLLQGHDTFSFNHGFDKDLFLHVKFWSVN